MSQKYDIGLNSKINDFARKFKIERTDDRDNEIFENFGNYIIASVLLEDELDNLNMVSTNQAQGIDGIVILVNNRIISEISDLDTIGKLEQIRLKIAFIQSTTQKSFDTQKLSAYTDEVVKFLSGEIDIEPYSSIYKKLIGDNDTYIDHLEETPSVSIHFLSGRTNHQISDDLISAEKRKFTERADLENKCRLDKYVIYQKDDIKTEYDKISKLHYVQLKLDTNIQLQSHDDVELSLLATIKFSEFKKLIMTSDGSLKERLFTENVRNFIGTTPVNKDIKKTLDNDAEKLFFPLLNNGLAIICDKIEKHPVKQNEFTLTFPRIINGCQTTNMLYNKHKESPNSIDEVEIVAKIISTSNNELKKAIVYAANNQNSIDKDLQSLNDFHIQIETFFSGKDEANFKLFFERLRGQHSQVIPPYSKVNIEILARIYISIFLDEPHMMKSNALGRIEQIRKDGRVFNNESNIEDYYYCGVLYYWMNHFLVNNSLQLRSKTMDMHLLLTCDKLLSKTINSTTEKIKHLEAESNAIFIFKEANIFLDSQRYLFEKRGFYSSPKTIKLINALNNGANN